MHFNKKTHKVDIETMNRDEAERLRQQGLL